MDKVKEFDRRLKSVDSNAYIMQRAMTYLLCGLGMVFMLCPVGELYEAGGVRFMDLIGDLSGIMAKRSEIGGFWWMIAYSGFLCGMGEWFYLMVYQRVQEGREQISIYKKLRYMPVTKAQIQKARYGYLNRFCTRMGIIAFIIQETVSLIDHSFGVVSVAVVFVWTAVLWIFGRIYLYFY